MIRRKTNLLVAMTLMFVLLATGYNYFAKVMRPFVAAAAQVKISAEVMNSMYASVAGAMSGGGVMYKDVIDVQRDGTGRVASLAVNTVLLNSLQAKLGDEALKAVESIESKTVGIPAGNLTKNDIFSGKGPVISIPYSSEGTVTTSFSSELESCGINQTLHRINLTLTTGVTVFLPLKTFTFPVSVSVCVAETVIVGEIPEAYTFVLEGNNGLAGTLNDYSATVPEK